VVVGLDPVHPLMVLVFSLAANFYKNNL